MDGDIKAPHFHGPNEEALITICCTMAYIEKVKMEYVATVAVWQICNDKLVDTSKLNIEELRVKELKLIKSKQANIVELPY